MGGCGVISLTKKIHVAEPFSVERQFKLLVDSVVDYAIYMLDPDGHVSSWNSGAQRIKGYSRDEALGEHFSLFFTDEDRQAGKPEQALQTARTFGRFEDEGWRVRKDGSRFWASVVLTPIHGEKGELLGYAKITRDITERQKGQEALDQARAAFFQSQKMEAVGQLAGGVAHDFNNMLTVIIGNLDVLTHLIPSDRDDLRPMVSGALRGAQRAAQLTTRLLAFGRRQTLSPKTVNLNKVVNDTSQMLRRTLGEAIAIEAILADSLWPCFVDPNQLETALLNLALNARDAMPNGGRLTLQTANMHFDESYAARYEGIEPGRYVMLSVTDSGAGISKENLRKVFEPFFTTKEVGKGSGLGLAQVYGSVKQSGGHVTVYSEVGIGTTIRLYLPRHLAQEELSPPAGHQPETPRARNNELVLVVEDDDAVRDYSARSLEQLGYRVLEAADAVAALAALDASPNIELMLADVGLPGMNGTELAKHAVKRRPSLRVLFTTGYAGRPAGGDFSRATENLLQKPFVRDELAAKIRQILDGDAAGPSGPAQSSAEMRTTVLVVDDEEDVLNVAANAIRSVGHMVVTARNGMEALTTLEEHPRIGLLFTDVKMPGIDGFMLADMAKIRRPDLKIIYATGYRDYVKTRPGVRHGNIIDKPYFPKALAEEIKRALGDHPS